MSPNGNAVTAPVRPPVTAAAAPVRPPPVTAAASSATADTVPAPARDSEEKKPPHPQLPASPPSLPTHDMQWRAGGRFGLFKLHFKFKLDFKFQWSTWWKA